MSSKMIERCTVCLGRMDGRDARPLPDGRGQVRSRLCERRALLGGTCWRDLLGDVLDMDDVESIVFASPEYPSGRMGHPDPSDTEACLDLRFNDGYGINDGMPFTAWTADRMYFPACYDGSEWVASVPRHPNGEATRHVGGG